jgi:selenocysteine-specific elongation factor
VDRRDGKAFLPGAAPRLGEKEAAARELETSLARDDAVRLDDRELAAYLETEGRLKRVGDGLAVSTELYERGRETLLGLSPITLAGFRDALGVSRKTAQLLLERYDADGLTRRIGDERVLRRSATS